MWRLNWERGTVIHHGIVDLMVKFDFHILGNNSPFPY